MAKPSKRSRRGGGTLYEEAGTNRKTKWAFETWAVIPNVGKKRFRGRGNTQKEAIAQARLKIDEATERATTPDTSVEQFMSQWLEHKKKLVRASTHAAYAQDVRLYICPPRREPGREPSRKKHANRKAPDIPDGLRLNDIPLAKLHEGHCQDLIDFIVANGSRAMADRVRRTLKQAMGHAVLHRLVPFNVLDRVKPVKRPKPKRGFYTQDQVETFLAAVNDTEHAAFFLLAFMTGARKGELLALKWGDVHYDAIRIERTLSKQASGDGTAPPKTDSGHRTIPSTRR